MVGVQARLVPDAEDVLALGSGVVVAFLAHRPVLRAAAEGGFASVQDNVVTVITDSAELEPIRADQNVEKPLTAAPKTL